MKEETPEMVYKKKLAQLNESLAVINEKRQRIAWLRLLIILLTVLLLYKTWHLASAEVLLAEVMLGMAIFLYVVSADANTKEQVMNLQRLIHINEEEIKIADNDYLRRETGISFLPSHHVYAEDLDVLGNASLYQYSNRCSSQQGKKLLANRLLYPSSIPEITSEQEAVSELKNKTEFTQQLMAFGAANPITNDAEEKINDWMKMTPVFTSTAWRWLSVAFPFFTAGVVLFYLYDVLPSGAFLFILFLCYLTAFAISAKISKTYEVLSKLTSEMETVQQQLAWIEKETFTNKKAQQLQQCLRNDKDFFTSTEVKKLYSILNRFDIRLNHFAFFFLNTFLLWDLHQLLALHKWKLRNENNVANWFRVIAEMEYSSSLATLAFNHPDWCVPVIVTDFFSIEGENIAHPLLAKKNRVANSFSLQGKGKTAIITGSNMGGKSTFLRSLGVNTVLALMGAPVCANSFAVSFVQLMSSMRVTDNLSENASTFYAELKKLKAIIEAANEKKEVFILLDEILRGTNSLDRHTGSVALIKQMIKKEAIAVIATHDVELAKLENEYPLAIANYHFDVQAEGNELYFDYKLKSGICQSLNASILMRNIGIEMD